MARAAVPGQLLLAEVLVDRVEVPRFEFAHQRRARQVQTLGLGVARARTGHPVPGCRPVGQLAAAIRDDRRAEARGIARLVAGERQAIDAHQCGVRIDRRERIRLEAQRAVLPDRAARVPGTEDVVDVAVLAAARVARAEDAAIQDAVEDIGRRVVAEVRADRLEDLVRAARVVEERDDAGQAVEGERRLAEVARVAAIVELVVLAVHVRVEAPVAGLERAGTAREARIDQARRQMRRAVPIRVDGREHPAAAGPEAVVARLAAHEFQRKLQNSSLLE